MGMGIGDWGLGPIPNPQSPIPILIFNNNILNKVFQLIYLFSLKIILLNITNLQINYY